jgi:hypothetical protein
MLEKEASHWERHIQNQDEKILGNERRENGDDDYPNPAPQAKEP